MVVVVGAKEEEVVLVLVDVLLVEVAGAEEAVVVLLDAIGTVLVETVAIESLLAVVSLLSIASPIAINETRPRMRKAPIAPQPIRACFGLLVFAWVDVALVCSVQAFPSHHRSRPGSVGSRYQAAVGLFTTKAIEGL